MTKCHTRIVGWDVRRPKDKVDRQNIIVYNINVLKGSTRINIKELKGKKL